MLDIHRILVPIDDTPLSNLAIDAALVIGARFGAQVHVLYVRRETLPENVAEQARDEEEFAAEIASVREAALSRLARSGLPADRVHAMVRTGPALDNILSAADDIDASLIVMGTHGRQGLADYFVGSTTERVLLRARQPLFVVREPPPEPA